MYLHFVDTDISIPKYCFYLQLSFKSVTSLNLLSKLECLNLRGLICGTKLRGVNPAAVCLDSVQVHVLTSY